MTLNITDLNIQTSNKYNRVVLLAQQLSQLLYCLSIYDPCLFFIIFMVETCFYQYFILTVM